MKFRKLLVLFGGLVILFSGSVSMASEPEAANDYSQLKAALLKVLRPGLQISTIKASKELPGMLEVQVENGPLVFVQPETGHMIDGVLLSYGSGQLVNLTEQRKEKERKKAMAALDPKDMIIFPAGQQKKHHVYIFTDVDCGYCRKIHSEVPELNARGIEVRYLAYPRAGLNSPTYQKMQSAWCAEDRRMALTRLKADQAVEAKTCDNPIAAQFELGMKLGVNGTPAIITESGKLFPGWMPAARLIQALEME